MASRVPIGHPTYLLGVDQQGRSCLVQDSAFYAAEVSVAALTSAAHVVNATAKWPGKRIRVSDTGAFVRAGGYEALAPWIYEDGGAPNIIPSTGIAPPDDADPEIPYAAIRAAYY